MEIIILIGSVQAIFFSILIFSKKEKSNADNILGAWLIIMFSILFFSWVSIKFPVLKFLGAFSGLMFPMLSIWSFIYTKTITGKEFDFRWLLHLCSLLLLVAAAIPIQLTHDLNAIEEFDIHNESSVYLILLAFVNFAIYITYCVASILEISRHKNRIKFEFSYEKDINLRWLLNINYSLLIISGLCIGIFSLFMRGNVIVYEVDIYAYIIVTLFIFFIGFWGFRQGIIFPVKIMVQHAGEIEKKPKNDSKSDTLNEEFGHRLQHYMISEKPYLNPLLTLYNLSSSLQVSSREFSTHLNKYKKTNFYEFINYYRVEEAKSCLKKNHKKFTILAIAFECGFNSKASFNRIFKNSTGYTPSEYMNQR